MIYIDLMKEFFKIGLFSFGGGYATIPFLYHISQQYHWYTIKELMQIIAIASITPGAVGINAATYAGVKTAGIVGAILASLFEILPAIFLVILVSKLLNKYKENYYIKAVISTLKPIGCALLLSVSVKLFQQNVFGDIKGAILLISLLVLSLKVKKSPVLYICISAIIGLLIQ